MYSYSVSITTYKHYYIMQCTLTIWCAVSTLQICMPYYCTIHCKQLYNCCFAGDILISAPLSSNESRESTPSGDTLTKNIHQSNQEWIQRPKPVPLSQQFSSSDSTSAHSSDKLRQLYADIANAGIKVTRNAANLLLMWQPSAKFCLSFFLLKSCLN